MAGQRGQTADGPRLVGAWGSPEHNLALRGASEAPAGRRLSQQVSTLAGYAAIRARIAFLMGSDRLAADDAIQVPYYGYTLAILWLYYGYTMATFWLYCGLVRVP